MQLATLCRLFFCVALAGCTTGATFNELVDNPTPLAPDVVSTVKAEEFEGHSFKSTAGSTLRYRLLKPSKLEPGKVYPLVVQLHGSGGIGTDNLSQLERMAKSWAMPELRKRYQAFILIPQFPIRSANYGPAAPDQFAISSPALQDAVELVKEFSSANPIDPTRIYATGFSMGGSASWLLPVLAPDLFAAIVPISGVAPKSEQAKDFLDLPVYAVHGTTFDLILGTFIGGAGYLLRVMNFPIAPFILGFVLGDMMEQNLRRALSISNGEIGVLFSSPIAIGLWVGAIAMLVGPRLMRMLDSRRVVAQA